MDELPPRPSIAPFLSPLAADAVAGDAEASELLDVEVDEFAWPLTLVPPGWLGRCSQLVEPQALEHTADRAGRDADADGDLLAGHALATPSLDLLDHRLRGRLTQPMGPRAAILQTGQAFSMEALDPFMHRARANACGFSDGLRRLPIAHHVDQTLSTERRQAGILVDVHSAPSPRTKLKSRNLSFLGRSRMDNLLKAHS